MCWRPNLGPLLSSKCSQLMSHLSSPKIPLFSFRTLSVNSCSVRAWDLAAPTTAQLDSCETWSLRSFTLFCPSVSRKVFRRIQNWRDHLLDTPSPAGTRLQPFSPPSIAVPGHNPAAKGRVCGTHLYSHYSILTLVPVVV